MTKRRRAVLTAVLAGALAMTGACGGDEDLTEDDMEEGPPTEGDEVVPGPEGPVD